MNSLVVLSNARLGYEASMEQSNRTWSANHFTATVVDSVDEGVIVYDRELRYIFWNRYMLERLGVDEEEILGRKAIDVFPKLAEEGAGELFARALGGETVRTGDRLSELPSMDEPIWIRSVYSPHCDPDGNIVGVVAIVHDVTERKRAELTALELAKKELAREKAEEQRRRIQRLVDSIDDPFFAVDHDWKITYANRRVCEFWGKKAEEVLGTRLWDAFPDAVGSKSYEQLCQAHERREALNYEQVSPISERWVEVHAFPFEDGLSVYFRDIEARKQAEEARERYEEQLLAAKEQAEQVAQLRNSLLSNISHELRTPLTSMLLQVQLLGAQADEEQKKRLTSIEEAGFRLADTLASVLTLSQLESGTLEPARDTVDLGELTRRVVARQRSRAERGGLALSVVGPDAPDGTGGLDGPVELITDPELVSRLLANLVDNAIKFTEQGEVTVDIRRDADHALIEVRDTGIGIDPAFIEDIYKAFKQESTGWSRSHQGTGLGLTISHKIVALLDGSIEVESEKNVGTTFKIKLPLRRSAPADA
jgi:PAS domain S-box-containing protein